MEDRLCTPSADFGHTPPPRIAGSRGRIAAGSLANKIDVGMVIICRPMKLKVIEKGSPIERQTMLCKVPVREGKAVVDTDKGRRLFGQHFRQPFRDPTSCPILLRTCWRLHFYRRSVPVRNINAQTFEARHRGFRTGVIHSDVPFECQWSVQAITSNNSGRGSP